MQCKQQHNGLRLVTGLTFYLLRTPKHLTSSKREHTCGNQLQK
jgi:hypothetical protein